MAASVPPNPNLGKSQALNIAQNTVQRLTTLVPTLTTALSPVTVYQPGPSVSIGNELLSTPGAGPSVVSDGYGVWVAPDFYGNGQEYYVQVECFGAGGGGGGGNATQGGGGGGGAEYACEGQYPVKPGQSYAYVVGLPGSGGYNNSTQANPGSAGTNGGMTVFDIACIGLANGVVANGGQGGDQTAVGVGGAGGTGSSNTIHFNGGAGGTGGGNPGGSDNPLALAKITGMFVGNTLSDSIIPAWYILNDIPPTGGYINDNSLHQNKGTVTNFNGGLGLAQTATDPRVPAYAAAASPPVLGNAQAAGLCAEVKIGSLSKPSSQISVPNFTFAGTKLTVSCWIQCDPSGTWGNTAAGSFAVIAANTQNYTSGNTMKGYALFWYNAGTSSSPNWQLYGAVGNGSSATRVSWTQGGPTPGQWLYVVMTYSGTGTSSSGSGTLTLTVNNTFYTQNAPTTGYGAIPAGGYFSRLFMDPNSATHWFFGSIANIWWATDCATSTLIAQAYAAGTLATGGSGGGASGGPSAVGGNGASSSGVLAGAGGVPTTIPASLAPTNTRAMGGYAGAAAGAGDASPSTPTGGSYGGGGGASGDMPASTAVTTLTIPFASGATYCGVDASSNPGTPYSVGQQANPNSGVTSVLFAGGQSSDAATGTKNAIMLLPATLKTMLGSGKYTVEQVSLTFTNAVQNSATEAILEVGYSADTVLPQTYGGASLVSYVGAVPVPAGSGVITYDLTPSGLGALLQSGAATALVLGPGDTPTFDAYNAAGGGNFYCSIYGPGAYDSFGNADFPYLTIVLQETLTTQRGSTGAPGAILVTVIDSASTPVAQIQPYAATDSNGNVSAQGYTGPVTAFEPGTTLGSQHSPAAPESWHAMVLLNGWVNQAGSSMLCNYRYLPTNEVEIAGVLNTHGGLASAATFFQLPASYCPSSSAHPFMMCCINTPTTYFYGLCDGSGNLSVNGGTFLSTSLEIAFWGTIPLGI